VDLVVDKVGQLQDVDVSDADRVVVGLARAAVYKVTLPSVPIILSAPSTVSGSSVSNKCWIVE